MSGPSPPSGSGLGKLLLNAGLFCGVKSLCEHGMGDPGGVTTAAVAASAVAGAQSYAKHAGELLAEVFKARVTEQVSLTDPQRRPVNQLNHDLERALARAGTRTLVVLIREWEGNPPAERGAEEIEDELLRFATQCERWLKAHEGGAAPETVTQWVDALDQSTIRALANIEPDQLLSRNRVGNLAVADQFAGASASFRQWLFRQFPGAFELHLWDELKTDNRAWVAFQAGLHKRTFELLNRQDRDLALISEQLSHILGKLEFRRTAEAAPGTALLDSAIQSKVRELHAANEKLLDAMAPTLSRSCLDVLVAVREEGRKTREHVTGATDRIEEKLEDLRRLPKLIYGLMAVVAVGVALILMNTPRMEARVLAALRDFPEAKNSQRQLGWSDSEELLTTRTYAALEKKHGLPPGTLARELPRFLKRLLTDTGASDLDRARAAYASRQPAVSERLALQARDKAIASAGPEVQRAIQALLLAGWSAREQIQYARAMNHFRDAAALSSRQGDPLGWAIVHHQIAMLMHDMGTYRDGSELAKEVLIVVEAQLGPQHPNTLLCVSTLAVLLSDAGESAEPEALYRRALEAQERTLGPEHPDTLRSMNNLAILLREKGDLAAAEPLYRRALNAQERVLGPEHPDTLASLNNLSVLLKHKGETAEAERLCRQALGFREHILGKEHPDTLSSLGNLAMLLSDKGDFTGAETILRRVLDVRERVLGPEHPGTLMSLKNLASVLLARGDLATAEPMFKRALTVRERVLGPEHPDTLESLSNLAILWVARREFVEAEPMFRRALAVRERVLVPDHPETLASLKNLALLLSDKGDLSGAEPLYRRALAAWERKLQTDHPTTLTIASDLGTLLARKRDLAGAEPLFRRALEGRERALGPGHLDTLTSLGNLGNLLYAKRDWAGAEPLAERASRGFLAKLGAANPNTIMSQRLLVAVRAKRAGEKRQ